MPILVFELQSRPVGRLFLFGKFLQDLVNLIGVFCAVSEWTYIAFEMANLLAGAFFDLNENNDLDSVGGQ